MLIIGSGPAGVAAAHALRGRKVLMLDVGTAPGPEAGAPANLYQRRQEGGSCFTELIGERFESLHNIDGDYLLPKLKAPGLRYVVTAPPGAGRIVSDTFSGSMSYARGGLASAWGAQFYRYDDGDLAGFPFRAADLAPHYDTLAELIGISGQDDDLAPFYGPADNLLPPLALTSLGRDLLQSYGQRRDFFQGQGLYIGRPRLGVSTVGYRGRPPCDYANQEFFQPQPAHVYTPSQTLDSLLARQELDYCPGRLIQRYQEFDDRVEVAAINIQTGGQERFAAKRLILAAGTLGSAKLALASRDDFTTRLPLRENPVSYIPLLRVARLGAAQETRSFYTQLNLLYRGPLAEQPVMGTFYAIAGILHSDVLFDLPLAIRSNIVAARLIIPATLVLHLWYPSPLTPENHVSLGRGLDLNITCQGRLTGVLERHLIRIFRRAGFLSLPALCRYPAPGNSYHYAGTLPMRARPSSPYETDAQGRLFGTRRVHVADGACFSALPAKNLSFTIMANAMRIAQGIRQDLEAGR